MNIYAEIATGVVLCNNNNNNNNDNNDNNNLFI